MILITNEFFCQARQFFRTNSTKWLPSNTDEAAKTQWKAKACLKIGVIIDIDSLRQHIEYELWMTGSPLTVEEVEEEAHSTNAMPIPATAAHNPPVDSTPHPQPSQTSCLSQSPPWRKRQSRRNHELLSKVVSNNQLLIIITK